jgi:ATP-dependent DNA helicase PIF1
MSIEEILASLNDEQLVAVHVVCNEQRNCVITGAGGTGKSHVIKALMQLLNPSGISVDDITKEKAEDKAFVIPFAVTAYTGIAASSIEGRTLHSLLGFNLSSYKKKTSVSDGAYYQTKTAEYDCGAAADVSELTARIIKNMNSKHKTALRKITTLVIDEVSMVPVDMLIVMDSVCQTLRNSFAPFGGMQVVLCGDFFQLKPVTKSAAGKGEVMLFETRFFKSNFPDESIINLTKSERNKGDIEYYKSLLKIRKGIMDEDICDMLKSRNVSVGKFATDTDTKGPRIGKYTQATGIPRTVEPTYLYFTNKEVRDHNMRQMEAALCSGLEDEDKARKTHTMETETLRNGNKVTVVKIPKKRPIHEFYVSCDVKRVGDWANGEPPSVQVSDTAKCTALRSVYEMTRFVSKREHDDSALQDKHSRGGRLNWDAFISEKKEKERTYYANKARNDVEECKFIEGTCVRLFVGARVMMIKNVDVKVGLANGSCGTVVQFDEDSGLPVVAFASGLVTEVEYAKWTNEVEVEGCTYSGMFHALPLVLAYASTVHKSQGLTLDTVVVNMERFRADSEALAYTALSRVRKMTDLFICNLDLKKITQSASTAAFYDRIEKISHAAISAIIPQLDEPQGLKKRNTVTTKSTKTQSAITLFLGQPAHGRAPIIVRHYPQPGTSQGPDGDEDAVSGDDKNEISDRKTPSSVDSDSDESDSTISTQSAKKHKR